jgi:hypothetical protein
LLTQPHDFAVGLKRQIIQATHARIQQELSTAGETTIPIAVVVQGAACFIADYRAPDRSVRKAGAERDDFAIVGLNRDGRAWCP